MNIYVGNRNINNESFKTIADVKILNYLAEDSECTNIILDGVLRQYDINSVISALELCKNKLRLNGILQIIDIDFDILLHFYKMTGNINNLNLEVFKNGAINCFLNIDIVKNICNNFNLQIQSAHINEVDFVIEVTKK